MKVAPINPLVLPVLCRPHNKLMHRMPFFGPFFYHYFLVSQ